MPSRRLTTAEAIAYASDPRNDNGQPNALHVMGFSYDSDCPNYEEHTSSIIEGPAGFYHLTKGWVIEADAHEFTREDEVRFGLPEGGRWIHNACRCWSGILPDDVESCTNDDGTVDEPGFAVWGPFMLVWDIEPGEPRDFTPEEALDRLASFLDVFEHHSPTLDRAVVVLYNFIRQVANEGTEDLEWGEPGDCWERIENDPDIREELRLIPPTEDENYWAHRDRRVEERDVAIEKGLGRHYGQPHCIWCLEAM